MIYHLNIPKQVQRSKGESQADPILVLNREHEIERNWRINRKKRPITTSKYASFDTEHRTSSEECDAKIPMGNVLVKALLLAGEK